MVAHGIILMKVRAELCEKLGLNVEVEMDTLTENTLHPENTLQDLATQTMTTSKTAGDYSGQKENDQETLAAWLGQKEKDEYDLSFPYLPKAKSPSERHRYPIQSVYVNNRRSNKMRGRLSGDPLDKEAHTQEENKPAHESADDRNSGNNKSTNHKRNEGNQNSNQRPKERRNAGGKSSLTSTHARNQTNKQGVFSKSQKEEMWKMGVEPSSDFVMNIMKNHHFILYT